MQLGDLDVARDIASQLDTEAKWRQLGELAMAHGQLEVAQDCLHRAKDYSGMMLMYSAQVGACKQSARQAVSSQCRQIVPCKCQA